MTESVKNPKRGVSVSDYLRGRNFLQLRRRPRASATCSDSLAFGVSRYAASPPGESPALGTSVGLAVLDHGVVEPHGYHHGREHHSSDQKHRADALLGP